MAHTVTIAHRGARSLAPENTLAAARKAYQVGADLWETDVAVTADNELILFHDDSLARTTDAPQRFPKRSPWTFSTFSAAEIHSLDAGSWFVREDPFGEIAVGDVSLEEQEAIRGEHIPTVREALQLTKDLNWRINLELKRQPAPQDHFPLVEAVLALIEEVGIPEDRVIFSSFVHDWLRLSQSLCPRIEVQALVGYHEDVPLDWSHLDFPAYNARYTLITPDEVRALEGQGIHINLFTVNDPEDWRRFTQAGVSGIITDFPQQLLAFLRQQDPFLSR